MAKSSKTIAIVAAVLFAALSLSAPSAEREDAAPARVVRTWTRQAQIPEEQAPTPGPAARTRPRTTPTRTPTQRVRPPEDPHKDTVILVEAFMVQARLSALYSLDVPQISRECKSVTAEHIQKLLTTTDAAVVTAGAKLALIQAYEANTDATASQPLHRGPPEKRKIEYVEVGTLFTAVAEVRRDNQIFMKLEFKHIAVEERDGRDNSGSLVERQWTSAIRLQPGKPTLVGATQDKEIASYLIVTANIKE